MKDLSVEDRLFYFERNFFTLDGLWFIETENETDFETALRIDLAVWLRLFKIIYKRIEKYLGITAKDVKDIIDILAFRWTCEKWDYEIEKSEPTEGKISIKSCPWNDKMARNPERKELIPQICKEVCMHIYDDAIRSLNPDIEVIRNQVIGLGDPVCSFEFKLSKTSS